jgi:hypothetical protein
VALLGHRRRDGGLDPDGLEFDRWLYVHGGDGRDAWRNTSSFVAQVPDVADEGYDPIP